jgi:hypothetical protein
VIREPICPYCETPLNESIPTSLEGTIRIRCPSCESIYAYTSGLGSYPIEDDLNLHITRGRLGSRVSTGEQIDSFDGPRDTLSRTIFCACAIIMGILIIAAVMLMILIREL